MFVSVSTSILMAAVVEETGSVAQAGPGRCPSLRLQPRLLIRFRYPAPIKDWQVRGLSAVGGPSTGHLPLALYEGVTDCVAPESEKAQTNIDNGYGT